MYILIWKIDEEGNPSNALCRHNSKEESNPMIPRFTKDIMCTRIFKMSGLKALSQIPGLTENGEKLWF